MAVVFVINIKGFEISKHLFLYDFLDSVFMGKFKNYSFNKNTNQRFIGELLKRYMICFFTGKKNSSIEIELNEYGKPLLKNSKICFFNISHSGIYVVGIVDSAPVGVDVERIVNIKRNVADQSFSKKEIDYLSNFVSAEAFSKEFFFIWTLKEAYVKALGIGLSKENSSFCVNLNDNGEISIKDNEQREFEFTYLNSRIIDDDFILATICTSPVKYILMDYNDFIHTLLDCNQFDNLIKKKRPVSCQITFLPRNP